MTIEAIAGAQASGILPAMPAAPDVSGASALPGGFMQMVGRGLGEVNAQLLAGQADMQQLATGNAPSLHQVMIRMEEARLSFQLFMQVRNRVLESYQDLMRMSV